MTPRLKQLLAERYARRCRGSLASWARHCGFEPARHHLLLIEHLEALAAGEIDRLMVFMPPGSAKSTYLSALFPPWYLAKYPEDPIIGASNTMRLAKKWGRRTKNYIRTNNRVLNLELSSDSKAADQWELVSGGGYIASGVGGTITGQRAMLGIIDDPIRGRRDAESDTVRDSIWDWYINDFCTRLKPGGRIALMHTRWHEDDLAGRLLQLEPKRWTVLKVPMESEGAGDPLGRPAGERLWADYFTSRMVEDAKRDRRAWCSLFQQSPAPEEGTYFQKDWFKYYVDAATPASVGGKRLPKISELTIYGASDYAVTEDGGDFTVHIIIGVDTAGDMYLLDVWRSQASSDVWVETQLDLAMKWKPNYWVGETGQISKSVGPFLKRRMRERKVFFPLKDFPTSGGDKSVRAQSIRGRIGLQGLWLPIAAPWRAEFESELLRFPTGTFDDQVDALGLIGMLLEWIIHGKTEKAKKPVPAAGTLGRHLFDERVPVEEERF